jgi:hypothetical protein
MKTKELNIGASCPQERYEANALNERKSAQL